MPFPGRKSAKIINVEKMERKKTIENKCTIKHSIMNFKIWIKGLKFLCIQNTVSY